MIGNSPRKAPKKGVKEEKPMESRQSLSHLKWDCKYHIVIVSKYRNRTIYGKLRKKVCGIIRELCRQRGIEIYEGHAMSDHIHLLLSITTEI